MNIRMTSHYMLLFPALFSGQAASSFFPDKLFLRIKSLYLSQKELVYWAKIASLFLGT